MADLRSKVLQRLEGWHHLGEKTAKSGAIQIARVPHLAPEAWLHLVFAPISQAGQKDLLDRVPSYAKSALREIHANFNGINLFSGNLFLYGRRTDYTRAIDNVLPWDMANANEENARRLPEGALLVGGSGALPNGIDLVELTGGRVIAVETKNWGHVLFEWASLRKCILSELDRLSPLFDERGRPMDQAALANFSLRRT